MADCEIRCDAFTAWADLSLHDKVVFMTARSVAVRDQRGCVLVEYFPWSMTDLSALAEAVLMCWREVKVCEIAQQVEEA